MSDLRQRTNGKANGNGAANGNGQPKVVVTEEGKKLDQRLDKTTGEQQARRAGGQNNNKAAGRHRCCEASESPEAGRQQRDLQ